MKVEGLPNPTVDRQAKIDAKVVGIKNNPGEDRSNEEIIMQAKQELENSDSAIEESNVENEIKDKESVEPEPTKEIEVNDTEPQESEKTKRIRRMHTADLQELWQRKKELLGDDNPNINETWKDVLEHSKKQGIEALGWDVDNLKNEVQGLILVRDRIKNMKTWDEADEKRKRKLDEDYRFRKKYGKDDPHEGMEYSPMQDKWI